MHISICIYIYIYLFVLVYGNRPAQEIRFLALLQEEGERTFATLQSLPGREGHQLSGPVACDVRLGWLSHPIVHGNLLILKI